MHLDEFFDYKNLLMQKICGNEKIVRLVTERDDSKVPNHTLPYSQIFPYEYVPETVDEAQTIICFDVDIDQVINKTFYVPVLYVWVFTHKSKIRLPEGGIRTDRICHELDRILTGNRFFGLGRLELSSVGRFSPITDYQGRVMTYYTKDWNDFSMKSAPSNRKHPDGV